MIQINERLRISRADDRNLQVEELVQKKTKKGEVYEDWEVLGYYSTLEGACRGVYKRFTLLSVDEVESLEQVITYLENARSRLSKSITEASTI